MKLNTKKYSPIILIILLVIFHRLATIPNIRSLPSDSGNIASFAEGLNSGEKYFSKDEILSDKKVYNWYTPAYVFLIRSLSKLFNGNYYLAFWSQVDILMFLFLLGCYLFGRDFIGGRKYGFFFMIINLIFIKIPMGGGWGIPYKAPRPAVLFISILPLVLWAFWEFRDSKRGTYFSFFILGSTFYIHPVSAPYWILSIWISYWFVNSVQNEFKAKIVSQIKHLLILLITMVPYILVYTSRYTQMDNGNLPYHKLMDIFSFRINKFYFKPFGFPLEAWKNFPLFLQILTILSIIIVFLFLFWGKKEKKYLIPIVWIISLFLVGSIIPFFDQKITSVLKRFPYEIDLARSYIFLPFIVYIIFFLFVKKIDKNLNKKYILSSLVIIFLAVLMVRFYIPKTVVPVIDAWVHGSVYQSPKENSSDIVNTLLSVYTSPGDSVFHFPGGTNSLYIRYNSRRALVYTIKDGGVLLYSGKHKKLLNWYHTALKVKRFERRLRKIKSETLNMKLTDKIISLARSQNADFLLMSDKYKNVNFDFGNLKTIKYKGHILVDLSKIKSIL